MTILMLDVPTVHCRSCKLNIEDSLDELPGVTSSEVDVDSKQVTVTYDAQAVDREAIKAAIEAAGYPISS